MTDKDNNPENLKTLTRLQGSIQHLVDEFNKAIGEESPADLEKRVRLIMGCFKLQDILSEKAKSETVGEVQPTTFLNMIPPNDEEIAYMRAELIRRYDRLAAEAAAQQIDK